VGANGRWTTGQHTRLEATLSQARTELDNVLILGVPGRAVLVSVFLLCAYDLTKSYISEVERGRRTPRLMTLKVLARRLRKPLAWLSGNAITHPVAGKPGAGSGRPPSKTIPEVLAKY
jgi:transcriptional regulator with XRE-family HTH domain